MWGKDITIVTFSKLIAMADLLRLKFLKDNVEGPIRKCIVVKGPESVVYNYHLQTLLQIVTP